MGNASISLVIQAALSAGTVFFFRECAEPSQWCLNCQIVPSKLYHNTGIKNSLTTQVNAITFVTTVTHAAWLPGTSVALWLQGPGPFTHAHACSWFHTPVHEWHLKNQDNVLLLVRRWLPLRIFQKTNAFICLIWGAFLLCALTSPQFVSVLWVTFLWREGSAPGWASKS